VRKTFIFTDIEGPSRLAKALGEETWRAVLRWHDETLRSLFVEHRGEEVVATGDGFFVGFDEPDEALACAVAIQRRLDERRRADRLAPKVRIGVHAADPTRAGRNASGTGIDGAPRIAALARGGEILSSRATVRGSPFAVSKPRKVTLPGRSEPIEIVSVVWG
jgi:class 3 adenylate cyclase